MNKPSESTALLVVTDPDAYSTGAYTSAFVPTKNFHSFMMIVMAGIIGAGGSISFLVLQAKNSSGLDAKNLVAGTTLVKATDDDSQSLLNFHGDELDVNNGYDHVAISFTVIGATSDAGAMLQGFDPRFAPASDFNNASVVNVEN